MKTYARLALYLHPYRILFIASVGTLALGSVLDGFTMILLIPFLRSLFGEAAVLTGATSLIERIIEFTVGGLVGGPDPGASLRNVVIIVMGGLILKNIFFYTSSVLGVTVREGIVRDMRDQLYAHLQKLPLGFFDRSKTGQLVARVFTDTNQTKEIISYALADVLKSAVSLVTFVTALLLISWKLTLIVLVVAPLFLGFLKPMLWRLRRGFRIAYDLQGELTNMLHETASGARLVKAYGAEEYEQRRFARANRSFLKNLVHAERINLLSPPLSEVLGGIVTLVLVWVGAQLVFSGDVTAAALLTFLTISLRVQSPLKTLSTFPAKAQSALAASDRFFEILDTGVEMRADRGKGVRDLRERVAYEEVHFAYGDGQPVLRGVSFEVRRGEVVALVGASGAGKSTIVDLLPHFYKPTAGRITLDGIDVSEIKLDSLRSLMGIVSQETVIFHDTVRANIAYGVPDRYSSDEVTEAARAANAHEFIEKLPDGYDTLLGDRGIRLSGGQRQRIAIARAILRDPPLLIFDEATSALDTESERLVQGAIDRLLANRTVIVIAHRLSTIRGAHQILVIDRGRIIESGHHDELIARRGPYYRLHVMQFGTEGEIESSVAAGSRPGVPVP